MFKWMMLVGITCMGSLVAETKILVFSGSTREGSFNKKLVEQAACMAQKKGVIVKTIDLRDYSIPFYDGDIEEQKGQPEKAKQLRHLMIESDAFIIATPEYNGSVSAVLKNALDWVSRSEQGQPSRDAFKGKRFAIMSTSPGPGGGSQAVEHLKIIIQYAGGEVVNPQVSVPNAYQAFNADGSLKNREIKEKLKEEIQQLLSSSN